jgi:hypothetical protein
VRLEGENVIAQFMFALGCKEVVMVSWGCTGVSGFGKGISVLGDNWGDGMKGWKGAGESRLQGVCLDVWNLQLSGDELSDARIRFWEERKGFSSDWDDDI